MKTNCIEVSNLKRQQGDFLLHIEELEIEAGLIHGLVGKNGAGKTTFIKCLMKLNTFQGSIKIFGSKIMNADQSFLQNVGYVNDKLFFNGELTIQQDVRFLSSIYKNWDESLFSNLLEAFSLKEHKNKKIGHLSKGMGVKFAIAAAIAHHPRLYILDEPTSGLDPIVRIEVLNAIKRYSREDGATVLFSTHILEDIDDIADTLMVMNSGNITPAMLNHKSADNRKQIINMMEN